MKAAVIFLWMFASTVRAEMLLHAGNGAEPNSLDPHKSEAVSDSNILRDLYEGLTGLSPRGEVIPAAAERWQTSADGLTWTFFLRPQARWSNGDPLTAGDFVAGMRRCVAPTTGSGYAMMLSPWLNAGKIIAGKMPPEMLGVEALDAQTLRIHLKAPTPYLPGLLTHHTTYPIHQPSLKLYGAGFARPGKLIGNGAYQLAEWGVQSHIKLTRNPHYWNNAATRIDTVLFYPTEDIDSELKRYRAGELDVTYDVPQSRAPQLRAELKGELRAAPYLGTWYLGFNLTRAPFRDNPKLRRALNLVVDRELIVERVMNGFAIPAYSWVPPGVANYTPQTPDWVAWPRAQRLAEARRLYADAGYSSERPLEVEIHYNTQRDNKRIATVIAAMWKQTLGVRVRMVNLEFKVLKSMLRQRLTQVFRWGWIGDFNDASSFADLLQTANGQNMTAYSDADYDALVSQAGVEADPFKRRALLEQAERRMLEQTPLIPIYFYTSTHLVKPHVQGWEDNLLDYHYSKDLAVLPH
ncbi:MAG: peptide ABC transporter substrate-binding protein [Pseudomonadota bacterium]